MWRWGELPYTTPVPVHQVTMFLNQHFIFKSPAKKTNFEMLQLLLLLLKSVGGNKGRGESRGWSGEEVLVWRLVLKKKTGADRGGAGGLLP